MKPKSKKGLKIVLSLSFYSLIMLVLAFSVATMKMKYSNDIANVMGLGFLPMTTHENSTQKDLLFVNVQTPEENMDLVMSDTVIFYELHEHQFIKGSIIAKHETDQTIYYQIDGYDQLLSASDILAVEIAEVPHLGSFVAFLQSPKGFALAVLMPVIFLWIVESIVLVRYMLLYHKRKLEKEFELAAREKANEVESEFEIIRKQLLKEFNLDK
ncbi:MAG: hypothetical protein A2Y45_00050 [Tenericutes bacterium GWC2_34_14]|nr:MAG: hypothetical protein A2Z84_03100 [Tenericutes bacterium GWA2_35_7]OHE29297.1 MAG: hypothetical protein A2Y45_00050 [Tenericutes bacterium GWC2_34_14]OHE34394.1 MAG: hypothetical protein A2012_07670 [Tenericutes bacterium GWE2_34_108]OHE35750.1 MAG: hypothetical protein A2Y46_02375 [Tenericutes bacterium GWF1_35_14]OHE39163.1 MAG: hypothetical protein A2Y44_07555 [Tenericutes bacterium GWF2_35_184]OHE42770.1 MAG: hypothetical protein A2221_08680 [Tenericutes bacterium RIFOXYA2_FULL_36_3